MRKGTTSTPLLLAGIAALIIVAIFVISRRNTTVAPERIQPSIRPSVVPTYPDEISRNNGVMEGEHNGHLLIGIDVTIINSKYTPEILKVKKGTAVTWKNDDDQEHTVTALDNSFDSGFLGRDQTFSRTFNMPGTYYYYSKTHPQMKGTVVITE
jgi:plastocyanin